MAKSRRLASKVREKSDRYHGACQYFRLKPDIAEQGVESVNITLTFEEALQLATAIQSAVLRLNRYHRSTRGGKAMGLGLSLKTGNKSLAVMEAKLRQPRKKGVLTTQGD